jgi:FdhE protein
MHRTADRVRRDPATRLVELGRQRPEWQAWLTLLSKVEHALGDPRWQTPLADGETDDTAASPGTVAPLLHLRRLEIDGSAARRLVLDLASAAGGSLRPYRPSSEEAIELLTAAVREDAAGIRARATAAGVDGGALASIAHLATLPLLQSCRRALESRLPRSWPHGYCPVCAAWPMLAERRGLDRSRQLRCGRCAAEWASQLLRCVYCGERDHRQLGTMVPEGGGEVLKVEICFTCSGYLKSVATLQRIPAIELLLRDLETVELDLVAVKRGYGRPEERGFPLQLGPA